MSRIAVLLTLAGLLQGCAAFPVPIDVDREAASPGLSLGDTEPWFVLVLVRPDVADEVAMAVIRSPLRDVPVSDFWASPPEADPVLVRVLGPLVRRPDGVGEVLVTSGLPVGTLATLMAAQDGVQGAGLLVGELPPEPVLPPEQAW